MHVSLDGPNGTTGSSDYPDQPTWHDDPDKDGYNRVVQQAPGGQQYSVP